MNVKPLFALATLAFATATAFADDAANLPLTRAEVVQSVLDARAAGTLIPAGGGELHTHPKLAPSTSSLTRAQERAEVLEARADGSLRHAGEAAPEEMTPYQMEVRAPSTLTRAQMKAEVLQARAEGELIPAGQGEFVAPEPVARVARDSTSPGQTVALGSVR